MWSAAPAPNDTSGNDHRAMLCAMLCVMTTEHPTLSKTFEASPSPNGIVAPSPVRRRRHAVWPLPDIWVCSWGRPAVQDHWAPALTDICTGRCCPADAESLWEAR